MASNPPAACCTKGFKHEGTPAGEVKKIDGTDTYVVYPPNNKQPTQAILFLTDVMGIYPNAQFVADNMASRGYLVVVPDLFRGDQLQLGAVSEGKVDLPAWLKNHGTEVVDPIVEKAIKYIRGELGVTKVAAAGYCFGAKYVVRYLKDGNLDAGFVAHPSFVTPEELGAITKPLSIAAAETDKIFPAELRHQSEEILIKTKVPYQVNLFSGVEHGFAVRADLSVKQNKFAKEQALLQAVTWFDNYL